MSKKVLFIDLDGTLVEPKSGKEFPEFLGDMQFLTGVLNAIKNFIKSQQTTHVFIVTNQGGIEMGHVRKEDFDLKLRFVCASILDYLKTKGVTSVVVDGDYCASIDKKDQLRKPNTGLLIRLLEKHGLFHKITGKDYFADVTKEEMFMTGDSYLSGVTRVYPDRDTAVNFGIDYLDISDFIKVYSQINI
jgi:histidinol phosphatase-like enzyme